MYSRATSVASRSMRTQQFGVARRAMATSSVKALGLDKLGLKQNGTVHRNLTYPEIAEHEAKQGSASPDMFSTFVKNGTFAVDTGKFTGRSPKDKWIVKQGPSADNVWWGNVNQPIDNKTFDELYETVLKHYDENSTDMYVFDGYCGASEGSQKKVRFVSEIAWQHHFVTNMFIRPKEVPSEDFEPEFTIINACRVENDKWKEQGLNSEVFVAFNIEKKLAVIGGTWYGGEMKKGIFSMMNYWLPLEGKMTMHCSANKGKQGDTALFFGLSGTGKTTLSADPNRALIGDDEHGWDDQGIFNFEGGCYAKTINLTRENEPEIFDAIKPNALLENISLNEDGSPDFSNTTKTENGRVSYPIEHIENHDPTMSGGHPSAMIFLTCDAYGVLPPVSKLTSGEAMYHFLSGYTAKVAGTERGVTEPEATFSACFGAAFMTLHPTKYAKLLGEKLNKHDTKAYLVNTGWSGGAYGVGKRMAIKQTRSCIDAILDGSIESAEFSEHPVFGFKVPKSLPGVPEDVLNARDTWADKDAYDATTKKLAGMFVENYKKYQGEGIEDFSAHGPKL